MNHKTRPGSPGWIEVICGSMFSGKTEELLRRIRRAEIARRKVQVFKPEIDQRYSADHVQSHDSNRVPSIRVGKATTILEIVEEGTHVVGIDEAQFFDPTLIDVVQKLAYRGKNLIIAGLDLDFRGQPFGPMPQLLAIAEDVTKLFAVCVVCGGPASRTQRIADTTEGGNSTPHVLIGAHEFYEARCRSCHKPEVVKQATDKWASKP